MESIVAVPRKGDKSYVQISLRMSPEIHKSATDRMRDSGLTFNGLVMNLLRRWLKGEIDRKAERPLTVAESEEDQEILRIVHHPESRAEKLVSGTMKHYLGLKREKEGV